MPRSRFWELSIVGTLWGSAEEELRPSFHDQLRTLLHSESEYSSLDTSFGFPYTNPNMSNPGQGFEYPAVEVSWLKRDVLLFANTIGCTTDELHFLYVRVQNQLLQIQLLIKPGTAPKLRCLPNIPNPPP